MEMASQPTIASPPTSPAAHFGRRLRQGSSFTRTSFSSLASLGSSEEFRPQPTTKKYRIICLHGHGSNEEITKRQLELMGLGNTHIYHTSHVMGPFVSEEAHDSSVEFISPRGPYHSWFPDPKAPISTQELLKSVTKILQAIEKDGPFDAVYGFSQGAALAALLSHPEIYRQLADRTGFPRQADALTPPPWSFTILACGSRSSIFQDAVRLLGLSIETGLSVPTRTIHLIGVDDPFKIESDALLDFFSPDESLPLYMKGAHGVVALTKQQTYDLLSWGRITQSLPQSRLYFRRSTRLSFRRITSFSSLASKNSANYEQAESYCPVVPSVMEDMLRAVAHLDADEVDVASLSPGRYNQFVMAGFRPSRRTLTELLESANPASVALRGLEYGQEAYRLTYGDILDYIHGDGNLPLKLGLSSSETVAYVAAPGIASAIAFLTVASQCTAAPLDPSMNSQGDIHLALEQLKPSRFIVFGDISDVRVYERAIRSYRGMVQFYHVTTSSSESPLFSFDAKTKHDRRRTTQKLTFISEEPNSNSVALLLRTSGTTSRPKVVPIRMGALVSNATALSKSLGLTPDDIALNAMPLFHIGGLLSNFLSSLAAAASVTFMDRFDADMFVYELCTSARRRQPTWYSAVPTMHFAILEKAESMVATTQMSLPHRLRFIRSGAAALPGDHVDRLQVAFDDIPVVQTYAMTEQMPITQPPAIGICQEDVAPGDSNHSTIVIGPRAASEGTAVGRPIATHMCVVNENLVPLPYGDDNDGEVCISGPNVVEAYMDNPEANAKSFFSFGGQTWFRTGDTGNLDEYGFLSIKGRKKELIKTGGEQVNPLEVEEVCLKNPTIRIAVCFPIPDEILGQRVGLAVVPNTTDSVTLSDIRDWLTENDLQAFKIPSQLLVVSKKEIPKTSSGKFKRLSMAEAFDLTGKDSRVPLQPALPGAGFVFALGVMFTHIGDIGQWDMARTICFHSPGFFFIGGLLMAAGTVEPVSEKKAEFYLNRLATLHPMYVLTLICLLVNLIIRCRPANFDSEFDPNPSAESTDVVCQATPLEMPWGATLATTVLTYFFALQSWFFTLPVTWFLSSYSWFTSVYYFCIYTFPFVHTAFHRRRNNIKSLWKLIAIWTFSLYLMMGIMAAYWPMYAASEGLGNVFALSAYLFPPGWTPCFALGVGSYFLLQHYKLHERPTALTVCGAITDLISLFMLGLILWAGFAPSTSKPAYVDTDLDVRQYAYYRSRLYSPIGFIWVLGLAVSNHSWTAKLLSSHVVRVWLAPGSYNMYLWHQCISEWYFVATRGVWWNTMKEFYWFSPIPIPVTVWETFVVVGIVIVFANILERYVNGALVNAAFGLLRRFSNGQSSGDLSKGLRKDATPLEVVLAVLHKVTGANVTASTELSTTGLSSMTSMILIYELKQHYKQLNIRPGDVAACTIVKDLADFVQDQEERLDETARDDESSLISEFWA